MYLGVYAHPPPNDVGPYIHATMVRKTWTTEFAHFASDYAAKSALWLLRL